MKMVILAFNLILLTIVVLTFKKINTTKYLIMKELYHQIQL